jgi:ornithine cyclodeaminase
MLILTAHDVHRVLDGQEEQVLEAVHHAYLRHAAGETALPHSVFLRFPEDVHARDRIIALPAYLGGEAPVAGVKWISSFPANIDCGIERASAAIILNSMQTGHPEVFLEGSVISARRTAASAALAARLLATADDAAGVTLVGCGVINFEVLRFLSVVHPGLAEVTVHDLRADRAEAFALRCREALPALRVRFEADRDAALSAHTLVSVATTATTPYLDTAPLRPGSLLLHVSLRDVLPEAVLTAVNMVDDADHVCRAATSLELAEQRAGDRSFIGASLGEVARSGGAGLRDPRRTTIFSPFGLGILDLAVAQLVRQQAEKAGLGVWVDRFLPARAAVAPGVVPSLKSRYDNRK